MTPVLEKDERTKTSLEGWFLSCSFLIDFLQRKHQPSRKRADGCEKYS